MVTTNYSSEIKQRTWACWSSLHIITANSIAVENTMIIAPDPKPEWFDHVKDALVNAQNLAANWVNNLSVGYTASVPNSLLDYGTDFQAFSQGIVKIIEAHPNEKGGENKTVKQVITMMSTLASILSETVTTNQVILKRIAYLWSGVENS